MFSALQLACLEKKQYYSPVYLASLYTWCFVKVYFAVLTAGGKWELCFWRLFLIAPCRLRNHSILSFVVGVYTIRVSSGIVKCRAFWKTELYTEFMNIPLQIK